MQHIKMPCCRSFIHLLRVIGHRSLTLLSAVFVGFTILPSSLRAEHSRCEFLFKGSLEPTDILQQLLTNALNRQNRSPNDTDLIRLLWSNPVSKESWAKLEPKLKKIEDAVRDERIRDPWVLSKLFVFLQRLPLGAPRSTDLKNLLIQRMPTSPSYLEQALERGNVPLVETAAMTADVAKLKTLGEPYAVLALHPGISSRMAQFLEFARPLIARGDQTPLTVLRAFKSHLGNRELIRALVLSRQQFTQIQEDGMQSGAVRNTSAPIAFQILARSLEVGHEAVQASHMSHAGAQVSPYMSLTGVIEIAQWVAKVSDDRTKGRYVFNVVVSELDLIQQSAEETLIWAPIAGFQILNRGFVEPEHYNVSMSDVAEAMRGRHGR